MLHSAEMIFLQRQDLVFPEDALSPEPVAYVHIGNPKTLLLEALYFDLLLQSRLFRGYTHTYRRQWNSIMGAPRHPAPSL